MKFEIWQLVRHIPTGRIGNYDGPCNCGCCKPGEVAVFFGKTPTGVKPEELESAECTSS